MSTLIGWISMLCLGQFHDNSVSKNYASWFKGGSNDFQQTATFCSLCFTGLFIVL